MYVSLQDETQNSAFPQNSLPHPEVNCLNSLHIILYVIVIRNTFGIVF